MYTLLLYWQRFYSLNFLFERLFERDGTDSRESYQLSDSFDDPSRIFGANFMDNALRGLLNVPAEEVDSFFAFDITSQLFKFVYKQLHKLYSV